MSSLIIVSAPSGAGKTTLVNKLLEEIDFAQRVITATTRQKRPGEEHGKDYYFLTKEEFERKIEKDEFIEWAKVYDNYYGVLKEELFRIKASNKEAILVVDVQGAKTIKEKIKEDVFSIFILPPSLEELYRRLLTRGYKHADAADQPPVADLSIVADLSTHYIDENLESRKAKAKEEIKELKNFDFVIVNDYIDKALERLKCIVTAIRLRPKNINLFENLSQDIKYLLS